MSKNKMNLAKTPKDSKLTNGPIAIGLVLFALPFLLSNILQHLYTSVDALIVKMAVSEEAYDGVIQSGKVSQVLVTFFMGISVGAGVVVSHFFGAKDKENIKKSVHTTMILSVILGAFLTFIGLVFSKFILKAIGTPPESLEHATKYLNIYFAGTVFLLIYNMGTGILRAIGDTVSPLIFLGISAVANVGLNLIFVPKYGVAGAAWVTVGLQGFCALMVLLRLFLSKKDYRLRFRDFKLDWTLCKRIFRLGLPTGLQNCVVAVAHLVMTYFYNKFPAERIGTYDYLLLDGFIYMPFNSFSVALSTFVGQNVGAGLYDRAKKAIKSCLCISMVTTVIIGILVFVFGKGLMILFEEQPFNTVEAAAKSVFESVEQQTITLAVRQKFMTVMVLSYPILVITDTLAAAIRGSGQAVVPAVVTILGMCVFRIVFMFVAMPFINDILVVYLTYPLSWILCTIALTIYYFKGKWKLRENLKATKT